MAKTHKTQKSCKPLNKNLNEVYFQNNLCKLIFLGWSQFPPIFEKRLFKNSTRTKER